MADAPGAGSGFVSKKAYKDRSRMNLAGCHYPSNGVLSSVRSLLSARDPTVHHGVVFIIGLILCVRVGSCTARVLGSGSRLALVISNGEEFNYHQ